MNIYRAYHETQKLMDFIELQEFEGNKVDREKKGDTGGNNVNNIEVGWKVHLKPIQGQYEVTSLSRTGFVVTCGAWKDKFRNKQMEYEKKHFFYSDFKCKVGQHFGLKKNK